MSQKLVIYEDSIGRIRASTTTVQDILSFTDYDFDVGGGGATTFNIPVSFTSGQKIDVYINGRKAREGALNDFTRNVGAQTVITAFSVPQNGWVQVRLYTG